MKFEMTVQPVEEFRFALWVYTRMRSLNVEELPDKIFQACNCDDEERSISGWS